MESEMTPQQIKLLNESFDKVAPIADEAAAMFYARLFEVAPAVKPMFQGDMQRQGQMLMSTIAMVVKNIQTPDKIAAPVQRLGQRHNAYGALPEHYPVVGEVLLWTLKNGIGPSFTQEHHDAWAQAYKMLSDIMIDAQQQSASQAQVA